MAVNKTVSVTGKDGAAAGSIVAPTLKATINTTSNWTVPAGVNAIFFALAGGGGGGSSRGNASSGGSSGGAAGGLLVKAIQVTPGQVLAITCGAGGTGAAAGTDTNGAGGGASYLSAGNLLFGVNGANRYTTSSGFGQYSGSPGNPRSVVSNTAGVPSFVPNVATNFVVEMGMTPQQVSNTYYNNYVTSGGSNVITNYTSPSSSGSLGVGLTPQFGNTANNNLSTNVTNTSFHLVGGGSGSGQYSLNAFTQPANMNFLSIHTPIHGQGAMIGGGGAGTSNYSGLSGSGGGGHGGVGGNANESQSGRGAGGGGGLTGAGNTANDFNGGNGGSGGGGGGGHSFTNNGASGYSGGNGGAGACLIYY
jgi:hypothetical protein